MTDRCRQQRLENTGATVSGKPGRGWCLDSLVALVSEGCVRAFSDRAVVALLALASMENNNRNGEPRPPALLLLDPVLKKKQCTTTVLRKSDSVDCQKGSGGQLTRLHSHTVGLLLRVTGGSVAPRLQGTHRAFFGGFSFAANRPRFKEQFNRRSRPGFPPYFPEPLPNECRNGLLNHTPPSLWASHSHENTVQGNSQTGRVSAFSFFILTLGR